MMKKTLSLFVLFYFTAISFSFSQNVGINTDTPDGTLHLYNSTAVFGAGTRIIFGDDMSAGGGLRTYVGEYGWEGNTDSDILEVHGANGIHFTTASDPGALLDAVSIAASGELKLNAVNTDNTATDIMVRQSDGTLAMRQLSTLGTGLTVIKEDAVNNRVGIGTATPDFTLDIVHQNGSPAIGSPDPHNGLNIRNAGVNNENWTLYVSNSSGDLEFYNQGAPEVKFTADGTIDILSDARAKHNIQPLANNTLSKLMKTTPCEYIYNRSKTGKISYGFLAQDVQKIFPGLVNNNKSDSGMDMLSVNYIGFVPYIVKSMQEQQAIIDQQQEKINTLEKEKNEILARLNKIEALLSK